MKLETFELQTVHDDPDLFISLSRTGHQQGISLADPNSSANTTTTTTSSSSSRLLLRIVATADYYTDRQDLMESASPTYTEIILDPWVYGLVPATIVPIAAYVLAVAALAYPLARAICRAIESLADCGCTDQRERKMK